MYLVVVDSPVSRRVRSPSWLDLRLVAGITLVLVSVLVGVHVVSAADRTARFWAAGRDLAAGIVLAAGDLHSVSVRLPASAANYVAASTDPVGQVLNRPVDAGDLIPRSALGSSGPATTVTIPLGGDDAPTIMAGQRITVWVSTKLCPSAVVLSDVAVQSVQNARAGALDAGSGQDVIVRVSPALAQRVVEALALDGAILRAGIVDGAGQTSTATSDLSECVEARS